MCYSDLPYLYTGRGLAELNWPYSPDEQVRARYDVMEYPVGIAYWAWATAWVTHWAAGSPDLDGAVRRAGRQTCAGSRDDAPARCALFVVVNAVGLALVTLLAAWFLAGVTPGRPWDAAAVRAVAGRWLLTGLVNWDLLAVALVAGALWAWARGRPVLTGVMIGLGTATKLYPLFLLGRSARDLLAGAPLARPARSRPRQRRGTWLLANLPAYLDRPRRSGRCSGPSTPTAAPTWARSGWWSPRPGT